MTALPKPSFPNLKSFSDRLRGSPLRLRLARGAFWSLTGTVAARGLGLCVSVLLARTLGRSSYGELAIIQATVGMFATFAGFGLGLTATKYVGELRSREPSRAGRIISLSRLVAWVTGTLIGGALFVAAPWLAAHTLAAPQLGGLLRVASLMLLFGAVDGTQVGALAGFEAFRRIAKITFLGAVVALPLVVGGVEWLGLDGAVLGLVAAQTVSCLLSHWCLRAVAREHGIVLTCGLRSGEWGVLWEFSLPALSSSLLVGPVYWLCTAMLVNRPSGYEEMGLFNAANQWFGALLLLPGVLGQAALPVLAECWADKDGRRLGRVLGFYVKLNVLVVLPFVIFGALASPYIMALYGPEFRHGWPTLTIVLLTGGLVAVQTPVGQVIAAVGRMWLGTAMNFGWAVCFVALTWLLVPWGAIGLAGARLAAYLMHATWVFGFARSFVRRARRAT